jgi:DNA replication protein DnaC
MRTPERWNAVIRPLFIESCFPPRIQKDLEAGYGFTVPEVDFKSGQSLYLWGAVGGGKTLLACELLAREAGRLYLNNESTQGLEFISVPKLLQDIKSTFNVEAGGATDQQIIDRYGKMKMLVMDDIGVFAKPSDWVLNTLYLIINARYEQQHPTIFTSNVDLNGLAELLDDRIPSRIQRMGRVLQKTRWDKN